MNRTVEGKQGTWNPPGRSMRWRVGMLVAGLIAIGAGVAVYLWPQIIVWTIAGCFALLGSILVVSALMARGTDAAARPPAELDLDRGYAPAPKTDVKSAR